MKRNVLIIGAGGVSHAAAHKCAQHNNILGDICIASRKQHKCDAIIESIRKKGNMKNKNGRLYSRQIDAMNIKATIDLIKQTNAEIVINLGQSYINMSVLKACIEAGAAYIDTGAHDEEGSSCSAPPWYAEYEWTLRDICKQKGITAILGAGFDPGVVNAYCAYAAKHHFDTIDVIDILDVNAGDHGKFFATNFDPEINLREFTRVFAWVDKTWVEEKVHAIKKYYNFPVVGKMPVYLTAHDEISSLPLNIDANTIRFWMGFSDHFINVFSMITSLGMTSVKPVTTAEGLDVVPLKVLKAILPEPHSLASGYTGKTCIGCLVKGKKAGVDKEIFIYNICDHNVCFNEVESQAISYTGAVPAVASALLVAKEIWDPKAMVDVEELDPDPFLMLLDKIGLPTEFTSDFREVSMDA
jgi:saccharopine dehydrogenase-like NADP-dependent oxidoreductase